MAEAGELALDDLAADHLPEDLEFDANEATIRQLLGHRSGLPDYYELGPLEDIQSDFQRVWTPTELLELVPTERTPPGSTFSYAGIAIWLQRKASSTWRRRRHRPWTRSSSTRRNGNRIDGRTSAHEMEPGDGSWRSRIKGPEAGFETVLEAREPIVDSFEFHPG